MNYWWDTRAYQQSNKVSPFSAAVCVSLALVMITLVVTKLDRPARSLADARDILDELTSGHLATLCRRRRTPKSALRRKVVQPSNATVSRYGGKPSLRRAGPSVGLLTHCPLLERQQIHAMRRVSAEG